MTTNPAPGVEVADTAIVGVQYTEASEPPTIGPDSTIRDGTIVYNDVKAGSGLQTGHHALIREQTVLGKDVLVGTQVVIDGATAVGNNVSMQTGVYVPQDTDIGSDVFLGPNATLLNDTYPAISRDASLVGPEIKDGARIGANTTILPGVSVGQEAFVAAGAVVTEDVSHKTLAIGVPAETRPLPGHL